MGIGRIVNHAFPKPMLEAISPLFLYFQKNQAAIRKYWKWFDETDTWSREKLSQFQWNSMKTLLEHAEMHIPFYRETWKAQGIHVKDIEKYEDLVHLPILTKQDIREHGKHLIANGINTQKLYLHETGGSTGAPLQFYYDQKTYLARAASMLRWDKYAGQDKKGMKRFYMGRPTFALMQNKKLWGEKGERFEGEYSPLGRCGFLASSNLTDKILRKYCDLLEKHKPSFLKGYSSALYILADYSLREKRNINFLKSVQASSDMVSIKHREITQKAWNCEIFDRYGMGEEVASAAECHEHNGYHLDMVKCLVEIIDPHNQQLFDKSGVLVGTCLTNYAMPLIRYQVGDRASLTTQFCNCGLQSLMLASLDGRCDDIIQTAGGKKVSGGGLNQLGMGIEGIREFQIIQDSYSSITIKIVCSNKYRASDEILFLDRLKTQLDDTVDIKFEHVEKIPRQPNGKFRLIISNINWQETSIS